MSDEDVTSIELAVIAFPGSRFNGQIIPAIAELVDTGIVHILDLALVTKGDDGAVTLIEYSDLDDDDAAAFDDLDGEAGGLLGEDDLFAAAEILDVGSSALVIVWENTWATRLIAAVRDSGGVLVAHDRLDAETVAEALAEAEAAG